jgi:fused signal recognition particle receptor
MSLFETLKEGLKKTRDGLYKKIENVLISFGKIDDALFEELEDVLISSDIGADVSLKIINNIKVKVKEKKISNPAEIKNLLAEELVNILKDDNADLKLTTRPSVIVVVGVNGVGKTTTIGKLASKLAKDGKKVIIAAADTFRAAAIDQLEIWSKRAGAEIIKHIEGSDPAAVVYDAIQAAKSRSADVLICDTAGRLHTKKNLMEELKKIIRVISRELPGSDCEILLVLDATLGQNALSQAKVFSEAIGLTGIVLTKLDGTAKGGIIIPIKSELGVPIKFIGVGERIEDLQPFNAHEFVRALLS